MIVETIVGIGAAAVIGITGYTGKRLLSKQDAMDFVIRGDGNGNPGLGEKIRDVHSEVSRLGLGLEDHIRESDDWKGRIVGNEVRIAKIETRCALIDCEDDTP